MKQPKHEFRISFTWSGILIIAVLLLSSLSIAYLVPANKLELTSGINQSFDLFFSAFHHPQWANWMIAAIILGGLGSVTAWLIGPPRALAVALETQGGLFTVLHQNNTAGVPARILWIQAGIACLLSLGFIWLPTINDAYWLFSDITAQLALVFYIMWFAAAATLLKKCDDPRIQTQSQWMAGLGILSAIITLLIGFIPATSLHWTHPWLYPILMIIGMTIVIGAPWLLPHHKQDNK